MVTFIGFIIFNFWDQESFFVKGENKVLEGVQREGQIGL